VTRLFPLPLALLPTALGAQADTAARRPIEIDDLFRLKRVGDPRVSPDGARVAYAVTTTSLADEKCESGVWMVPFGGGPAIRMTAAGSSASRPRWSPDGKSLSFAAARGEKR